MKLPSFRPLLVVSVLSLAACALPACGPNDDEALDQSEGQLVDGAEGDLDEARLVPSRLARYRRIRTLARLRGIQNTAFVLGGIAITETGFAHCYSEATWACPGLNSPDCGGGPVIAGANDGHCWQREGGLGIFQFDAGTYEATFAKYGADVLTLDGQIGLVVTFVVNMVKNSAYIANVDTDAQALAWINRFDVTNAQQRDQWIKTVLRYYNGCQPNWSCWAPRIRTYTQGLNHALSDTDGAHFWSSGTTCAGGNGTTDGAIDERYRALGGCSSVLGVPMTEEKTAPDTLGRYSVFENGSIYWSPATGAHDVRGPIRDKWAETGWELGLLGYPVSGEYDVPEGRRNDFERGSIVWNAETNEATVLAEPPAPATATSSLRLSAKTAPLPASEGAGDLACRVE